MLLLVAHEVTPQEIIDGDSPKEAHIAIDSIPGPAYCGLMLVEACTPERQAEAPVCERCHVLWMRDWVQP